MKRIHGLVRFRKIKLFFNTIIQNVGSAVFTQTASGSEFEDCEVTQSLSESDFYRTFLFMKIALSKSSDIKNRTSLDNLTFVNVDHMALILSKPDDFVMPALGRNSLQGQLASESGRTLKSLYSSITRLKKAGLLVVTEDNLIEPNQELKTLRRITKKHLKTTGIFPTSYIINFLVTGDGGD